MLTNAFAFKLPDTGQTKCYSAVSPYDEITCPSSGNPLAQDGSYNINPMSYTDNGNGTVTDNNTGLMWQKCSVGQNNDATCSGNAATYNWYQASGTYDATYNTSSQNVCGSLSLGGYSDWRVPAKKELITIVDYSIPSPGTTIKSAYFPNTVVYLYWSSTTYASDPDFAWDQYFSCGYVGDVGPVFVKSHGMYVRCVRAGQNVCSSPAKHYKCLDGTDGTNQISSPSKWSWTCGGTTCSERKSPGPIEN